MQERDCGFKSLETFSSIIYVEINVLHLFIFTYVICFTIPYFNHFWLTKSVLVMIALDNRLLWSRGIFRRGTLVLYGESS